jgi:hypothetical protein
MRFYVVAYAFYAMLAAFGMACAAYALSALRHERP